MVEVFSRRYIACNQMFVAGFRSPDTIFVLAYAVVLLNTDLHSRAVKANRFVVIFEETDLNSWDVQIEIFKLKCSNCFRRMKREDFVRNLRGIDAGADLDEEMLHGIYDRLKANEFRPGSDHVSQVKVG